MKAVFVLNCLALLLVAPSGCGQRNDGPATVKVTGAVTLDGEPLPEGNIAFRRVEGDQKGFGGTIEDGRYAAEVEPGKMMVEITATRVVPGKFTTENGPPEPVHEMYIPAKYNSKTTLDADVPAGRNFQLSFELTSQ